MPKKTITYTASSIISTGPAILKMRKLESNHINKTLKLARAMWRREAGWGRRRAILRWCEAMKKGFSQIRGVS